MLEQRKKTLPNRDHLDIIQSANFQKLILGMQIFLLIEALLNKQEALSFLVKSGLVSLFVRSDKITEKEQTQNQESNIE